MGDDPPSSGSSGSSAFPPRKCPKCKGYDLPCDLCGGGRVISRFKAAAYYLSHPEIRETPEDFPAVRPPNQGDKEPK